MLPSAGGLKPKPEMSRSILLAAVMCLLSIGSVSAKGGRESGAVGQNPAGVGILIMAHGGTAEWNRAVEESVAPLRRFCPVEVAFGMADRESLQDGVSRLEESGVHRVAVVRLFVSAESFRQQTEYFLGLRSDPPEYFLVHGQGGHHRMEPPETDTEGRATHFGAPLFVSSRENPIQPISGSSQLILNREGLYDSSEIAAVMVSRVLDLSQDASRESVLVLAHGEGDDDLNSQWLAKLSALATQIKTAAPFRAVRVETLREDWKEKREVAEERIRGFVTERSRDGEVIVVPFRVFGFGPYRQVLEGLDYVSDGRGILPSPGVTNWIRHQAEDCFRRAGWSSPFAEPATAGK